MAGTSRCQETIITTVESPVKPATHVFRDKAKAEYEGQQEVLVSVML